ncbi:hypothetical protein GCM10020219_043200 [Nonomuraea dietziae]
MSGVQVPVGVRGERVEVKGQFPSVAPRWGEARSARRGGEGLRCAVTVLVRHGNSARVPVACVPGQPRVAAHLAARADLILACVGRGLRALRSRTKLAAFARRRDVKYNGNNDRGPTWVGGRRPLQLELGRACAWQ